MIFECLYHLGVQEAGLLLNKRGGGEEQGRGDQDWGRHFHVIYHCTCSWLGFCSYFHQHENFYPRTPGWEVVGNIAWLCSDFDFDQ